MIPNGIPKGLGEAINWFGQFSIVDAESRTAHNRDIPFPGGQVGFHDVRGDGIPHALR